MIAEMLWLPMNAALLTTLILGSDGFPVMPLTVVAVVVAYVAAKGAQAGAAQKSTEKAR